MNEKFKKHLKQIPVIFRWELNFFLWLLNPVLRIWNWLHPQRLHFFPISEFHRYCVKRELRSFRRGWGLLVLVAGGLHFILYYYLSRYADYKIEGMQGYLHQYFTGFHIFLFLFIPLIAWNTSRTFRKRWLEQVKLTYLSDHEIIFYCWIKSTTKPLVLLFLVYASLLWSYPWLHATGFDFGYDFEVYLWEYDLHTFITDPFFVFDFIIFVIIYLVLLIPFHESKRLYRATIISSAFPILICLCQFLGHSSDDSMHHYPRETLGMITAHAHMAVTIPYFLINCIFLAMIATRAGLNSNKKPIGILAIRFCIYPGIIELIVLGFFMEIIDRPIYEPGGYIRILYYMLIFHASFLGALWLALKWNFFWMLWNRPLIRNQTE